MDMRIENKVVPIYANSEAGNRCHIRQLDTYFSKIPDQARELDIFYLRPLGNIPDDPSRPWFAAAPVGENKFCTMVKEMFAEVGVVNKTDHSLRATGATDLYTANVPEKLIQQRTGHRSLKAPRTYEWTTGEQELAVLTSGSKIDYTQAQQSGVENPGESSQESSTMATLPSPEQQHTTNPPSQMLKQLCQVSQTQSFAPNLMSLFGSTTNCVINVNCGQSSTSVKFQTRKTSIMKCQKKWTRLCQIWTSTFDLSTFDLLFLYAPVLYTHYLEKVNL